jgi:hypothetical protein
MSATEARFVAALLLLALAHGGLILVAPRWRRRIDGAYRLAAFVLGLAFVAVHFLR